MAVGCLIGFQHLINGKFLHLTGASYYKGTEAPISRNVYVTLHTHTHTHTHPAHVSGYHEFSAIQYNQMITSV